MTTLVIQQNTSLKKTHFKSLGELREYLDKNIDEPFDIDFRLLKKGEVSPALRARMEKVKKLPASRFVNI